MTFFIAPFIALLSLSQFVVGQNASPAQLYWIKKMPNTPIPKFMQEFLPETNYSAQSGANLFSKHDGIEEHATSNNVDIFFFEDQLKPGSKFNVQFSATISKTKFIPAAVAKSMSMSSKDLPQILAHFSINPNSSAAKVITETINDCETVTVSGEHVVCLASLEQIVDFSTQKLDSQIQVKSTEVKVNDRSVQEYTVQEGVKRFGGHKKVACHAKNFVYPMFMCHDAATSRAYSVLLIGANGSKVNALVSCHDYPPLWSANSLAFKMLKIVSERVPICHFLPEDHIMFGTSK